MAVPGQQEMTQEELDETLHDACGEDNDFARAEELLGWGADQRALVNGFNALHWAARFGNEQIVTMLLSKGAVLEARTSGWSTALQVALLWDKPEVCLLLIAKGANPRVKNNDGHSGLSLYGSFADLPPTPSVKAQRVAELTAAFRAGCHPSQVQRRKDENWAKRWPLMNAATGCGFLLMAAKKAELKATALPTDVKLPDEPTATEEQRRALRHFKVLGNIGLLDHIASFIQDKERGEEEEDDLLYDFDGEAISGKSSDDEDDDE